MLPPLKPIAMKECISMLFIEYGQIDVLDGAFVVVDKNGVRTVLGGVPHARGDEPSMIPERKPSFVFYLRSAGCSSRKTRSQIIGSCSPTTPSNSSAHRPRVVNALMSTFVSRNTFTRGLYLGGW